MEAQHVYLLMKNEYRISRNTRASWYFNHINDIIKYTPTHNIVDSDEELSIISIVPVDPTLILVRGEEYTFRVTSRTGITFLAQRYRLVFTIDMSPSVASLDMFTGETLLDEVFTVLKTCLKGLAQPVTVPGVGATFCPELYITVLAHTPVLSSTTNEVFTQAFLLTQDNVDDFLVDIKRKLVFFENCLADTFRRAMEDQVDRGGVGKPCDQITNPEANFISLLRCGILALQLLPENSSAGVIVITDGLIGIPDATLFESLMVQLRNATIPCSFLHVGTTNEASSPLGRVTHNELMKFLAMATFGAYFAPKHNPAQIERSTCSRNVYHRGLLFWGFQNNLDGFKIDDHPQYRYTELTEDFAWTNRPWHPMATAEHIIASPTVRKKHSEATLRVDIVSVLSVRLRDGYSIKDVAISQDNSAVKVTLVKPWRDFVWIEYVASASWPLTKSRETNIEVRIEGSYEFLHDVTFSIKATFTSPYRLAVIKKFWHTLQSITETDQLLVHLQSFNQNPMFYTISESVRSGLPLFHVIDNSTTSIVNAQESAPKEFAAFWKPILMLDINIWHKWLHTHRIELVLQHDPTLPKYLYIPNSSGRHQNVQCQKASTSITSLLRQWSSFVLLENHSYIKFIYSEGDKLPTSFYIVRATPTYKLPCLVLRLAFPLGMSGSDRNHIISSLRDSISKLRFPHRVTEKTDKRATDENMTYKSPLMRTPSEVPVGTMFKKPIERILVRYDHIPRDLTSLDLSTASNADSPVANKRPINMFTLLYQYLHHKRWVWRMPYPELIQIPLSAMGFILSTLAQLRLQEGFHFTSTNRGIINLALELTMKNESSDIATTCVVQYIIFPPHPHPDNTHANYDSDALEGAEDDAELQLVTECWVEPQCGTVINSPHESCHFDQLLFHQLPDVLFPVDRACVLSLVNFEILKEICHNTLQSNLPNAKQTNNVDGEYRADETISVIDVPFDVTQLLPQSQQIELLFSTFINGVESGHDKSNNIMLEEFHSNLRSRHDRELILSATQCNKFLASVQARKTTSNDWIKFPLAGYSEEKDKHSVSETIDYVKWKCFIKAEDDKLLLLVFVPASYADISNLAQNVPNTSQRRDGLNRNQGSISQTSVTVTGQETATDRMESEPQTLSLVSEVKHDLPYIIFSPEATSPTCSNVLSDNENAKISSDVEVVQSDATNSKPEIVCYDPSKERTSADKESVVIDDSRPSKLNEKQEPEPMRHGLVMPVYVYAITSSAITDSLVHRWDFNPPADTTQDFRQVSPEFFPRQFSHLAQQDIEVEIETPDSTDVASEKGNSLDRRSNDSTSESPSLIKAHTDIILECYFDGYVTGVFQSLQLGYDIHHDDVDCAINRMCQESVPFEIDICPFIRTTCGHVRNAIKSAKCDDAVDLDDGETQRQTTRNVQFQDREENRTVTADGLALVNLVVADLASSPQNCENIASLHKSITDKFLSTVHKWFKSVQSFSDFYYFCPDDDQTLPHLTVATDSFSGENTGLLSDANASGEKADIEDNDDADEFLSDAEGVIINITDALFSGPDQCPDDRHLPADFVSTFDTSFDHADTDSNEGAGTKPVPLFICFTCTLKTKSDQHYVPSRLLPTCFGALTQSLPQHITTIDVSDMKLTFDLYCLSRVKDTDVGNAKRDYRKRLHSSLSEINDADDLNRSMNEISQRLGMGGDHLSHLTSKQRQAVIGCIHEIEWLLQDEVVSALRFTQPVTRETLTAVTEHITKSVAAHDDKPGCILKNINLQFVYGSNSSMVKFTEEFLRMSLLGYQLCTIGDFSYLLLDRSSIHALALKCALDELNQDQEKRTSLESDLSYGKRRPNASSEQAKGRYKKQDDDAHFREQLKGPGSCADPGSERISVEKEILKSVLKSDSSSLRSREKRKSGEQRKKSSSFGEFCVDNGDSEKHSLKSHFLEMDARQQNPEKDLMKVDFKGECKSGENFTNREKSLTNGDPGASEKVQPERDTRKLYRKSGSDSLEIISVDSTRRREKQKSGGSTSEQTVKEPSRLIVKRHSDVGLTDDLLHLTQSSPNIRASKSTDSITPNSKHDISLGLAKIRLIKDDESRVRNLSGISGPDTPLSFISTQPQTPSWLSSTGSYTEDGYDAGLSDSDSDDYTSLSDASDPCLPDFWLIMRVVPDKVILYFHVRTSTLECDLDESVVHRTLMDDVTAKVLQTCRIVNQKLLLEELHRTRICDQLLVPAADEDVSWTKDSTKQSKFHSDYDDEEEAGENVSQKYISTALHVSPGQFGCQCVWTSQFPLHPLIRTIPSIKGQHKGLQLLKLTVLANFSVTNRKNMFVYKENNTDAIFYLKLEEIMGSHNDESLVIPENVTTVSKSPSTQSIDRADSKPEDTVSNSSAVTHKSLQSLGGHSDVIHLSVFGICPPGGEIRVDLTEALQKRLDTMVLDLLTRQLHRNHSCKLTWEDVHFIQRPQTHAPHTIHLSLPVAYTAYLFAVVYYLRQNLRLFLLTPNYADNKPDSKYADNKPDSKYTDNKPDSKYTDNKPNLKNADNKPDSKNVDHRPDSKYADKPESNYAENKPDSNHTDNKPDSNSADHKPDPKYTDNKLDPKYADNKPDPKYVDNKPDAKAHTRFCDYIDGQWQVVPEGSVFLYNYPQSLGHKGLACICTAVVDQNDNARHLIGCPAPDTDGYAPLLVPSHDFDKMVEITDWTSDGNGSLTLTPIVRFRIWDQGHADMKTVEKSLRDSVRHAMCDVITEYRLLTAPICEVPPDEDISGHRSSMPQSAPASPRYKENKEKRFVFNAAVAADMSKSPLRPTVSSPSPLHHFFKDMKRTMSPSPKEAIKVFDFPNTTSQQRRRKSVVDSTHVDETVHDSSSRRHLYEAGDLGCLHPIFITTATEWLEYCITQGCPSVSKTEHHLSSTFSVNIVLREFQSYLAGEMPSLKLQAFQIVRTSGREGEKLVGLRYNSSRQCLMAKDTESESSLDMDKVTMETSSKSRFILIGRSYEDWERTMRQQNIVSTPEVEKDTQSRKGTKAESKVHWHKFPCHDGRTTSGEMGGVESCFVPRQSLLFLNITGKTVCLYLYNYQMSSTIARYFTLLIDWQNARSHLLVSHISQKMGLYHHSIFTVRPPMLRDNYFMKNGVDEDLLEDTTPCKAETLRQNAGTATSLGKARSHHLTFRDMNPAKSTVTTVTTSDPVVRHLSQAKELRAKYQKSINKADMLERLFVEWNHRPNSNTPISEDYLKLLKRSSRLLHYCATPLLFSPYWRSKALTKQNISRPTVPINIDGKNLSVDLKNLSNRVRNPSGTSTDSGARTRRAESLDSKKRPAEIVTVAPYEEEAWHTELRTLFVNEYIEYLVSQQFVRVYTRPSSPKRRKTINKKPTPMTKRPDKMFRDSMRQILQKTTAEGIILVELGFQHVHFCVKLYGKSSSRQRATPYTNHQTFVDDCDKYRDLIHVHSFAHDFHLRTIQMYIEGQPSPIPSVYNVIKLFQDFVDVYSYPPSFARNYLHQGSISFSGITTSSTQLFDYIRSHNKLYHMQALSMDASSSLQNAPGSPSEEHALVCTNFGGDTESFHLTHGYKTGLVVGLDKTNADDNDVLHLQFYILLSSERELFPRLKLEKRIGAIKAAIMRQLPADKSFTVECHNIVQPNERAVEGRLLLSASDTPPSASAPDLCLTTPVNYLGYSNLQQQNMYRFLESQVTAAREKISGMVDMSLTQCLRDTLWHRLIHDSSTTGTDLLGLTYSEFTELLSMVHIVSLSKIDPRLTPLLNLSVNNCRGLSTVLANKYPHSHRRFSSPDQLTHYIVILSPVVRDMFMIQAAFHHKDSMMLAAVYQEGNGDVDPTVDTQPDRLALVESFVNACGFFLWSNMFVNS